MNREDFLDHIKDNILKHRFHINVVSQEFTPRFAYTIGLFNKNGYELVLAGNMDLLYDDIIYILNFIGNKLINHEETTGSRFEINIKSMFELRKVDESWTDIMLLGVNDFYNDKSILSYQIHQIGNMTSVDIPNMNCKFKPEDQPIWRWLTCKNDLNIPQNSKVVINKDILYGAKALEIMRWDENEWEIYSMNPENLDEDDMRIIPVSTIIGIDNSLERILELNVGKGLIRDSPNNAWESWG